MVMGRAIRQYRVGFVLIDLFALLLAFILAHGMRQHSYLQIPTPYINALPYTLLIFLFGFRSARLYEYHTGGLREVFRLLVGITIGMGAILTMGFFYRGFSYSRLTVIFFGFWAFFLPLFFRLLYRTALDLVFDRSQWLKKVLIIGESPSALMLLEELHHSISDYSAIGILTPEEHTEQFFSPHRVPILGDLNDAETVITKQRPDLVIVADADLPEAAQRRVIEFCLDRNILWLQVPRIIAPPGQELGMTVVGNVALLGSKGNNITGFNYFLKRFIDSIVSASLLILLAPLMLVVAALIKIFSKGPIFFSQERIGYRGRSFKFYKFRSMHVRNDDTIHRDYVKNWIQGDSKAVLQDNGVVVHKLTRDPRIIPVIGAFIRKFSIDELPQLFNVLKGDMSLVGPRPCLPYEVELYDRWHKMRFDALPGITGLWQVSGRNRLTFDQMVALDVRYLQNWTLAWDFIIMVKTPFVVFFDKAY